MYFLDLFKERLVRESPNHDMQFESVQKWMTSYADDARLSWNIGSVRGLNMTPRAIEILFGFLEDMGMKASLENSAVIFGVAGNRAKQWLHKHKVVIKRQAYLKLDNPYSPLYLPLVSKLVYWGVLVSYNNYGKETMMHRLQAARTTRARLIKVLRSSRFLSKHHRSSLWLDGDRGE